MRGGLGSRGYTIIEVMIFLAVSGVTFIIAASFINGKQSTAEFKQGVSELTSSIQQVAGDVNNGLYQDSSNFTCKAADTGAPYFATASKEQGTNVGCVFAGKVIQFAPAPSPSPDRYDVISIVSRQYAPNSKSEPPKSFNQAKPVLGNGVSLIDKRTINWGVTVKKVLSNNVQIGAFGFYTSPDSGNAAALNSTAQSIYTIPVDGSALGQDALLLAGQYATVAAGMDSYTNSNPKIKICLDGSNGQHAYISIGAANGQRTVVSSKITQNVDPECV